MQTEANRGNSPSESRQLEQMAWRFFATLREIARHLDVRSHELEREVGLSSAQLNVLWVLSESGPAPIGKIARAVGVSNATLSATADRLEEHGLLTRSRSSVDKRRVLIELTEEGRSILKRRPLPFGEAFVSRLGELQKWQRTELLASVQHVSAMIGGDVPSTLLSGGVDRESGNGRQ